MNLIMEYEDKISFSFQNGAYIYILHKPGYAFQRLFFYHEELWRRGTWEF